MQYNEENKQDLRIFDTIRACVFVDDENKFLKFVEKFIKIG
jgi:hypothetical protein